MASDRLQILITNAVYNNQRWLSPLIAGSSGDDATEALNDIRAMLDAISGLTYTSAHLNVVDTLTGDSLTFDVEDPIYGGDRYLSSADATTLRTAIINEIADVGQPISTNLDAYDDVIIVSYRSDGVDSGSYTISELVSEGLEIFVSEFSYASATYLEKTGADNIDDALADFSTELDSISGLEFSGLRLSSQKNGAETNLFLGVENATYNAKKYLTSAEASTLRTAVLNQIASMAKVDDSIIEAQIAVAKNDATASAGY